jgi:5-methylcytosine-specific restriction protein B
MASIIKDKNEIWDDFLQAWPANRLIFLTLEQYVSVGDKTTFAYWLEHITRPLGSIRGGSAAKFGIYKRGRDPKGKALPHIVHSDSGYSWKKDLGDNQGEAFLTVRAELVKIAKAAKDGDLQAVEQSPLAPTLKWKVAFLYQNRETPRILNIMTEQVLQDASGLPKGKIADCNAKLMRLRGDKTVLEYGKEIWNEFSVADTKDSPLGTDGKNSDKYDDTQIMISNSKASLNTIYYGPPGTGKTHYTVEAAVFACEPEFEFSNRDELKDKYNQLCQVQRIQFVTFHQSYSYEEFVEGLKASTKNDQIHYNIDDGIFKRICIESAAQVEIASDVSVDVKGKTIWKMSLGNTQDADDDIYDFCISNNVIRLGYGDGLDFTACNTKASVEDEFTAQNVDLSESNYPVTAVNSFKNGMKQGDLVIITDGNLKFRAIAEITSDYEYSPDDGYTHYVQSRNVIWHRVYENSLTYERIMRKKFSQPTIYQPSAKALNLEHLQDLLTIQSTANDQANDSAEPRVLIIDEINRGNISSIFGELITLIEPSKRAGEEEALTVTLPYSKNPFSVPNNLHIIGTMNTADRSLALMDTALRRRFDFIEMMPDLEVLKGINVNGIDIPKMLEKMNQRIEVLYDREHTLGHAFFIPLKKATEDNRFEMLQGIFKNKILPLLEEYFFEDWEKIRLVLGDNQKQDQGLAFISMVKNNSIGDLFGNDEEAENLGLDEIITYQRNDAALGKTEAYQGIYGK